MAILLMVLHLTLPAYSLCDIEPVSVCYAGHEDEGYEGRQLK